MRSSVSARGGKFLIAVGDRKFGLSCVKFWTGAAKTLTYLSTCTRRVKGARSIQ